jgi:hypothetical protein
MSARDVHGRRGGLEQRYLCRGRRRHGKAERSTRAINQSHQLRALAALGVADLGPPCLAGTKVPSTKPSSHRICSRAWSWARKARPTCSSVPSRVQRCRRAWTVLLGPYRRGTSLHWAPVHKIHSTPSKQRRSSAAGRPPRAFLGCAGHCPWIFCPWSCVRFRHVIRVFVPLRAMWVCSGKHAILPRYSGRGFRIASQLDFIPW